MISDLLDAPGLYDFILILLACTVIFLETLSKSHGVFLRLFPPALLASFHSNSSCGSFIQDDSS